MDEMSSLSFQYQVREDDQYIPILIVGRISSFLSILGSICVMLIAWKSLRTKILHRLIFGLSLMDLISSIALFFMPFTLPASIELTAGVGTHATCTLTGFFLQFCVAGGACYNAYLSLYYLLLVQRNWKERDFKKWMEMSGHAFAIVIPFVLAFWSALTQSINPQQLVNGLCVASPWPWGCDLDEDLQCTRSSLELVRWQAMPTAAWIVIFSLMGFICTGLVSYTVQSTIKRSSLYTFQGDSMDQSQSNRLTQVQIQSALYSVVYFNSILWIVLAIGITEGHANDPEGLHTKKLQTGIFVLEFLFWLFFPLQGFLNFFVFTRVKAKQWKKVEPQRSIFWIYKQIIFSIKVPNVTTSMIPSGRSTLTTQRGSSSVRMMVINNNPTTPTTTPLPAAPEAPSPQAIKTKTAISKGTSGVSFFDGSCCSQSEDDDSSSSSTAVSHTYVGSSQLDGGSTSIAAVNHTTTHQ